MIAILDPALLKPRADEEGVLNDLRGVLKACRSGKLRLIPFDEYWALMWKKFGRLLQTRAKDRHIKDSLRELQKLAKCHPTRGLPPFSGGKIWRRGFQQLFQPQWMGPEDDWEEVMARAVIRAVATMDEVVILTRRIPARNVTVHQAGSSELWENTRWIVHVQPRGIGARHIPCVYDARNLALRWTTRFDARLPAVEDDAKYPFCPPAEWWKPEKVAVKTVESKPCFIGADQNAWARPNIQSGAGYHWDVFIANTNTIDDIGLRQLNIVEFGAPASEGRPGHVHHVPAEKRHRFRDAGWRCP